MSSTTSVSRRLEIDAGHRLMKHEGKCRVVHGHRYVFEVHVTAPELDPVGRVVDFGIIKAKVGGWLEREWDHALLLHKDDHLAPYLIAQGQRVLLLYANPTAEVLASLVLNTARAMLTPLGLNVWRVVCHETPNCSATVTWQE